MFDTWKVTFVMFVGIVFFLKLAAGHASAPDLLKEKYSGPSILRPWDQGNVVLYSYIAGGVKIKVI